MLSHALLTAAVAAGLTTALPQPQASGGTGGNATNPFAGREWYANPYYAAEINDFALPNLTAELKPAAEAVAKTGSFVWMDTRAKISLLETYLADIKTKNAAGANIMATFVVYDLPDRDCAALASNGELALDKDGENIYKTEYIDKIASIIKQYPDVKVNLAIEPDCKDYFNPAFAL